MTTKDKTGDQLMASIRKTKTETAGADKQAGGAPQEAAAAQKTATAKAKAAVGGAPAKRPRVAKKKVAAKPRASRADSGTGPTGYQSSGRVWPD